MLEIESRHTSERIVKTPIGLHGRDVTAGLFHLSRTASAELIRLGSVSLNYQPCLHPDAAIRDGDVISVRGKGKGTVTDTGGRSRKDRIFVTAERRV